MKKFTKVCLIIAAAAAVFGIAFCIVSKAIGGSFKEISSSIEETGLQDTLEDLIWSDVINTVQLEGGNETRTDTVKVEEIDSIDIDTDLADIKVVKSDDAENVKVTMKKGYMKHYSCKPDGKTLEIEYDTNSNNYKSGPEIIVEVPDGIALESIEIDTALGNIKFEGLTLNTKALDVYSNLGDVKFTDMTVLCDINAGTDLGNVKLVGGKYGEMNLNSNLGDITIQGELTGDVTASCDMGDIKAELSSAETDYNYYLSTDMGDVEINDAEYNKELAGEAEISNKGAKITLTLDSSMGDVKVTTK